MTLSSAPELVRLSDLGQEWRHVASDPHFSGAKHWLGDLNDEAVYRRFRLMVNQGKIVIVQHRWKGGTDIFAKITAGLDPRATHMATIAAMSKRHTSVAELSRQRIERKHRFQARVRGIAT